MTDIAEPTAAYSLEHRYTHDDGVVYLTGIQALARIPVQQLRRDRRAGLRTAAFVSGYPGSPLGGFDVEVARAARLAPDLPVVCRPAVNEELGATAVMGSQLAAARPDHVYDGVVGLWYGKAPGLDRAGDALRHAVFAGTSRHSGAVALVGDDPAAKSSTLPSSSDATLLDLHMPILYPGDIDEVLELGVHAVAMSRAAGVWTSMKIVAAVADGAGTVDLGALAGLDPVMPVATVDGREYVVVPDGRLLTPRTLELEREFREIRLPLAVQYAVENDLNRVTVDPAGAWIGLVASGFTYHELLQALGRLGLDSPAAIEAAGIRLLQMRMPVPISPDTVRRFARGLEEIVVVEEKNPTLEWLVKDALYGGPDQPVVVGKKHEDGRTLMRDWSILDADAIVEGVRERLARRLDERLVPLHHAIGTQRSMIPVSVSRSPYFCSGCPHNWSTKVPEGTLVGAGIGCHGMVLLMDEERVGESLGLAVMGNEGTQWVGMSPFVETDHVVQNLGDGTFFHSGQLSVQQAVAAGVNITFKLLYNGTVAMTGGQDAQGAVGVPDVVRILLAHGVAQVLVTTDDVGRYRHVDLPDGVEVWDRTRIVEAQERLAAVPGTTVLVHDQACAAQARRLRKRGDVAVPDRRVVINHRICEGCGDCGDVSNCLSVQPLDTPLGRKTTIDQSSCNLDFSCLHGDCPSFMTVELDDDATTPGRWQRAGGRLGGKVRGLFGARQGRPTYSGELPEPDLIVSDQRLAVRMAGIGGTGVVTVAQILGTAALLDGWEVRGLDQTGLSQKAGPVVSDLRLQRGTAPSSNLLGLEEADVLLAFDLLAAVGPNTVKAGEAGHTVVVGATTTTPTGSMVADPTVPHPALDDLQARLDEHSRPDANVWVDSGRLSRALLGSTAPANMVLLGAAYQAGTIPVPAAAIEQAIDLNGVAVDANRDAFRWGRRFVVDPDGVLAAAASSEVSPPAPEVVVPALPPELAARVDEIGTLVDLLAMLAADLIAYQDRAAAEAYLDTVGEVADAERRVRPGSTCLTEAVARNLHKLLAYKDEYEVARLLLGPEGAAAAASVGEPGAVPSGRRPRYGATVRYHLHPPLLKRFGLDHKIGLRSEVARPAMRALARGKRLRGTALDPFGRTELRRTERELPGEYRAAVRQLLAGLSDERLDEAVAIAGLPDLVRGYEDLKMRRVGEYRAEMARRLAGYPAA